MKNLDEMSIDELTSYFREYHRSIHGKRVVASKLTRDELKVKIRALDDVLAERQKTFLGRERLRDDGWDIPEVGPFAEAAKWFHQRRVEMWNWQAVVL